MGIGAKNEQTDKENWNGSWHGIQTISKEALLLNHYTNQKRMDGEEFFLLKKRLSKNEN